MLSLIGSRFTPTNTLLSLLQLLPGSTGTFFCFNKQSLDSYISFCFQLSLVLVLFPIEAWRNASAFALFLLSHLAPPKYIEAEAPYPQLALKFLY